MAEVCARVTPSVCSHGHTRVLARTYDTRDWKHSTPRHQPWQAVWTRGPKKRVPFSPYTTALT